MILPALLAKGLLALALLAVLFYVFLLFFSKSREYFWKHQILWGRSRGFYDSWAHGHTGARHFSFSEFPKFAERSVLRRLARYAPSGLIELVEENPRHFSDIVEMLLTVYKENPDELVSLASHYERSLKFNEGHKAEIERYLKSMERMAQALPLVYAVRGLIVPLAGKCRALLPDQLRPFSRLAVEWFKEISGRKTASFSGLAALYQVVGLVRDDEVVGSLHRLLTANNVFVARQAAMALAFQGDPEGLPGVLESIQAATSKENLGLEDAVKLVIPELSALRNYALMESGKTPVILGSFEPFLDDLRRDLFGPILMRDFLGPLSSSNEIIRGIKKAAVEAQFIGKKIFGYIGALGGAEVPVGEIIEDLIQESGKNPIIRIGETPHTISYELLVTLARKNLIPFSETEVILINKAIHVEVYHATLKSGGPHGVDDGRWEWEDQLRLSDGVAAVRELCAHKSKEIEVLLDYVARIPDFSVILRKRWDVSAHSGSEDKEVRVSLEERRKIAIEELRKRNQGK